MYDMYSWNQANHSGSANGSKPSGRPDENATTAQTAPTRAAQAVQVALDRRDNGGEASR